MKEECFWPDKFEYNGDNWTTLRLCGKGTFSSCFHVCNENGNHLALKVFKKSKYEAVYTNEIEILRILKDGLTVQKDAASFFTKYVDCFTIFGYKCIIMELLGCNLKDIFVKNEREGFSLYFIRKCLHDLMSAAVFLEQFGLVHGDIKPTNILWNSNSNSFQLVDFGLSFAYGREPCQQLQSPGYQAPEVLQWNKDISRAVLPLKSQRTIQIVKSSIDLWSIGCVVVYVSTGQQLYGTEHAQSIPLLCTNCKHKSGSCSHSQKTNTVLSSIKNNLSSDDFDNLTNVLCGLLQCIPSNRLLPQVVLKHPFLLANSAPDVADLILLPTKILRLFNMFDTTDEEDREDILMDIQEECESFGQVVSVIADRKFDVNLEYHVYVEFKDATDCEKAQRMLTGRQFNDRFVIATFFPVYDFFKKHFY